MIAGTLTVEMVANVARLQQDMQQVRSVIGGAMSHVESVVAGATRALGALGVALSAGAVVGAVKHYIDLAASLDDVAERTGATVEELSKLQQVVRIGGHSMDTAESSLIRLAKALHGADEESKGAGKALAALGLSADALRGKDTAESLRLVAVELSKYQDGAGKTALAMDLLGKSGAQALPFLKDLASEQGIATRITAQQAAAAEELGKSLARLQNSSEGFRQELALATVPWLQKVIDRMVEAKRIGDDFLGTLKLLAQQTNVFATPGENLKTLSEQLANLEDPLNAQLGMRSEKRIADIKKQIEWEKFLQRQQALSLAGGDTPGERARMGAGGLGALNYSGGDDGKEAADYLKMLEKYRQMDAASWVKHIDETTAEYERGLAEEAKLTEEFYKKKAILDAADQKAMFDLIDAEQEYAIAAGAVMTQEITENHKKIQDSARGLTDAWRDVDRVAHDTFISIFDSGKNTFDRLKDTLKNGLYSLLYNMTLKPFLVNVVTSSAGSAVAEAAFPGVSGGGGIGLSSLSSIGTIGNALTGGLSSASATAGSFVGNLFGGSSAAFSVGAALPYVGLGLAALSIGKSLFGSNKQPAQFTGGIVRGSASQSGFNGTYFGTSMGDHYSEWADEGNNYLEDALGRVNKLIGGAFADMTKLAEILKLDTSPLASLSTQINISGVGENSAAVVKSFGENIGQLTDKIAVGLMPNIAEFAEQGESLTQTFARLALTAEAAKEAEDQLALQQRGLNIHVLELQGQAEEALAMRRADELAALDPTIRATQQLVYALEDQASAAETVARAQDVLRQAYDTQSATLQETIRKWGAAAQTLRAYGASLSTGGQSYGAAASEFNSVAARARLGDIDAAGQLQAAGEAYRMASLQSNSSAGYAWDLATIRSGTNAAADVADRQGSMAQRSLDNLNTMVSQLGVLTEKVVTLEEAMLGVQQATVAAEKSAKKTATTIEAVAEGSRTLTVTVAA